MTRSKGAAGDLRIAIDAHSVGTGLGGNESYPDLFQPFGGFPDGVNVENSYITMPELPGIGFEGQAQLYKIMRELAE